MNTTNTNTLQTYPQVQAIEPTEKMQWQQEKQLALRVYGGLIMVIGGAMAAYSDINHISDTMTIIGAVMFFIGGFGMQMLANTFSMGVNQNPDNIEIHYGNGLPGTRYQ